MPFDKLCRLVPKGLPIFYKVHLPLLSRLNLQKKRFSETYFLYYFTKYRQQLYQEIMEGCKNKKLTNISITGLQCTGKSYFLADFVLRQRALGEKLEFRILYINSSRTFLSEPVNYIFIELLSAICFDFDLEKIAYENLVEMKELPQKINSQTELLECLIFLKRRWFLTQPELLQNFFQLLREYYEFKGKMLLCVWDQLNELYRSSNDSDEQRIFKVIDNDKCFHCRLVSASNTNENMINRNSTLNITFEINPFLVFANKSEGNENELFELVLAEAIYVRPSDILPNQIYIYAKQVFELINESIIEYLYYKKQKFSSKTFEEAKKTYLENRKN